MHLHVMQCINCKKLHKYCAIFIGIVYFLLGNETATFGVDFTHRPLLVQYAAYDSCYLEIMFDRMRWSNELDLRL